MTADLTPAGPYQSGQGVLLVIDVTNTGGSPARGVQVANATKSLRAETPWGGCERAPCPAFALAALEQRQITVPATIIDADAAIDDTVTVSAPGLPTQRIPVQIPRAASRHAAAPDALDRARRRRRAHRRLDRAVELAIGPAPPLAAADLSEGPRSTRAAAPPRRSCR